MRIQRVCSRHGEKSRATVPLSVNLILPKVLLVTCAVTFLTSYVSQALRAFRVLRPLRLVSGVPSLQVSSSTFRGRPVCSWKSEELSQKWKNFLIYRELFNIFGKRYFSTLLYEEESPCFFYQCSHG